MPETTSPEASFGSNIQALTNAIGLLEDRHKADLMLRALDSRILPSFPAYVTSVWNMEMGSKTAGKYRQLGHLTTEQYQDAIKRLDSTRRIEHDAMISGCSQLNRFCDICGIPRFAPDLEDDADGHEWLHRKNCAEFCGHSVLEVFEGRDGNELSRERMQAIRAGSLQHGTPGFDEAVESASEHKGLPSSNFDLEAILASYQTESDGDDVGKDDYDGPDF